MIFIIRRLVPRNDSDVSYNIQLFPLCEDDTICSPEAIILSESEADNITSDLEQYYLSKVNKSLCHPH